MTLCGLESKFSAAATAWAEPMCGVITLDGSDSVTPLMSKNSDGYPGIVSIAGGVDPGRV